MPPVTTPEPAGVPPASDPPKGVRPPRERILDAAMRLVEQLGMQALTQARVAADAGLRQSHLTYYYPTRNDLIKAVAQAGHAELMAVMSPSQAGAATERAMDLNGLREFIAARVAAGVMPRLMLALMAAADEDPSLGRWLVDLKAQVVLDLQQVFAGFGLAPSKDDLRLFHACLVGVSMLGIQPGGPESAAQAAHLIRLAFDRLVASAPPLNPSPQRSKS